MARAWVSLMQGACEVRGLGAGGPPHVSTGLGTMLLGVSGSCEDREVASLPEELPREPDSEKDTWGGGDTSREGVRTRPLVRPGPALRVGAAPGNELPAASTPFCGIPPHRQGPRARARAGKSLDLLRALNPGRPGSECTGQRCGCSHLCSNPPAIASGGPQPFTPWESPFPPCQGR